MIASLRLLQQGLESFCAWRDTPTEASCTRLRSIRRKSAVFSFATLALLFHLLPGAWGQTRQVTFRLDPGYQIEQNTFYVSGAFNSWALTQALTRGTDGYYSATVSVSGATGSTMQYKFVNGGWSRQESLTGACRFPSGTTRYFRLPAADTTLGLVCFNQCSRCDSVLVKLQVTLTSAASAQGVHVAGTFQGWNAATTSMSLMSGNTYQYQRYFAKGSFIEYKFINGNSFTGAETVSGACSYNPQSKPNRFLRVPQQDTTISVVFGSCTNSPTSANKPRIAFVGSSSTYGFGSLRPAYMSYPGQFSKLYQAAGKTGYVCDFGRNSTTMAKNPTGGVISYWTSADLPLAIAYDPNVLVINLGPNDVKSTSYRNSVYKKDYLAMLDTFKLTSPTAEMFVSSPIRTGLSTEPLVVDSLIPTQLSIAQERGLGFIDIHGATMPGSGFQLNADSTHSDSAGYAIVAARVMQVLSAQRPVIRHTSTQLIAPSGYAAYQWYKNGALIAGATASTLAYTGSGDSYKTVVKMTAGSESRLSSNVDSPAATSFTDIAAGFSNILSSSVAWGDYDKDGDLDLAIAGQGTSAQITKIYRKDAGGFVDIGATMTAVSLASLAWGDYDHDDDLDLIVTGTATDNTASTSTTKLYQNTGGTFTAVASTGLDNFGFSSVAWGDYDNDGDLDLLMSGYDATVSARTVKVYTNNGSGSFTANSSSFTGASFASAAWADFDNDGDLDVSYCGLTPSNTYITKFYANTAGVFSDVTTTVVPTGLVGVSRGCLTWGDCDNDGDLDLFLTGSSTGAAAGATCKLYLNSGGVLTSAAIPNITAVFNSSATWGDFDSDGDLDLAVNGQNTSSSPLTRIYTNDGTGAFTNSGFTTVDLGIGSVAWGDYDSDGDLDLIVTGTTNGNNTGAGGKIFRNDGTWSNTAASAPTALASKPSGTGAILTWNKAGDLETGANGLTYNLRVGTSRNGNDILSGQASSAGLRYLAFRGMVQWRAGGLTLTGLPAGKYYWSVQAVDAGLKGSAWAAPDSFVVVTYTDIAAGLPSLVNSATAWGDFDNDGDLDLALAGQTSSTTAITKIYRNDGSSVFTDLAAGLTGVGNSALAWGDYDHDGDLDLLVSGLTNPATNTTGVSIVYQNTGGSFTDVGAGLMGFGYSAAAWGDYDNDGDLDMILSGFSTAGVRSVKMYRNEGGNVFSDLNVSFPGVSFASAVWGDYDNDGDLDIALSGVTASNAYTTKIYRNDAGSFIDNGSALTGVNRGSLAWGDYDADGDLDLLMTGSTDGTAAGATIKVYANTNGSFADAAATGLTAVYNSSGQWGDYDNDGDLDILLLGQTSASASVGTIFRNQGGNVFSDIRVNLTGGWLGQTAWGDYDNDGDLDIAFTCSANGTQAFGFAKIFRAASPIANTAPTAPTGLAYTVAGSRIVLTWNKATDAETPQAGLNYNLRIGTSSGANDVFSGQASAAGLRRISAIGLLQYRIGGDTVRLKGGQTYYWSVQAVDAGLKGGAYATEASFTAPTSFANVSTGLPNLYQTAVTWGDYDNDGDLDAFVSGQTSSGTYVSRVYNNNAGVFTDIAAGMGGVYNSAAAWGDYDNDGDLDIVVTGQTGASTFSSILYRNTAGSFTDAGAGLTAVGNSSVAWGDYDNDGDLDLLLTGLTSTVAGSGVTILYKNNSGTLTATAPGILGLGYSSVAWGDYDNDGDLDIASSGFTSAGYKSFIHANTNGSFTEVSGGIIPGLDRGAMAWGDYDNDGDLDLLAVGSTDGNPSGSYTHIFRNNSGLFTDMGSLGITPVSYASAAWGDYDNDGDLDIAMSGVTSAFTRPASVYQNNGGSFSDIGAGLTAGSFASVAWGDYDNDGDLDLLTTGTANSTTAQASTHLYRCDGSVVNTAPGAAFTLVSTVSGQKVGLSWGRPTDGQTPQAGLSYNYYVGTVGNPSQFAPAQANTTSGYRRLASYGPHPYTAGNDTIRNLAPGSYVWAVQAVDGGLKGGPFSAQASFTITNQPPTASLIHDTTLCISSGTATKVVRGISDGNEFTQALTITAVSDNISLLPNPVVSYSFGRDSLVLSLSPVAGQSGTATVTLTLDDGYASSNTLVRTFQVTIGRPAAPTITVDGPTALCVGDQVPLLGSTGYPTYIWSNGSTTQTISAGAGTYTLSVKDALGCQSLASSPVTITASAICTAQWDGSQSTDWTDPLNWTPSGVPLTTDSVIVVQRSNQPILPAATTTIKALSVTMGATLALPSASTLAIARGIWGGGSVQGDGTLLLNGTTAQKLQASLAVGSLVLTNSQGAKVLRDNVISLTKVLAVRAGALDMQGNRVRLRSTAAGTAYLESVSTGTLLNAQNLVVERYIAPGGSLASSGGWVFVGPMVQNQTLDAWRTPSNPYAYGTYISNNYGNISLWGYDVFATTPATTNGYVHAGTAGTDPAAIGRGFRLYTRPSFYAAGGTFSQQGTPQLGSFTYSLQYCASGCAYPSGGTSNGWNLVSNPYAAPIDWDASSGWTKTGLASAWWTYSGANNQFATYLPGIGGTFGATRLIAQGQGFFVKAVSAGPQLALTPAVVSSAVAQGGVAPFVRSGAMAFRLRLADGSNTDEALLAFRAQASNAYLPSEDAVKMIGGSPTLALRSVEAQPQMLAIGSYPLPAGLDTIPLVVNGTAGQALTLTMAEYEEDVDLFLLDRQTRLVRPMTVNSPMAVQADPGNTRYALLASAHTTTSVKVGTTSVLQLWPNPASIQVLLTLPENLNLGTGQRVELFDASGRRVRRFAPVNGASQQSLDLEGLGQGVYQIRLGALHARLVIE
ncbi:FG-GAP-like repeat-containing protein [Nostoc sp. NIES-2111]